MSWSGAVWAQYIWAPGEGARGTDAFWHTVGARSVFCSLGASVPGGLSGGRNLVHTGWARRSRGRPWPCGGRFSLSFDAFCPAPGAVQHLHVVKWNGVGAIFSTAKRDPAAARPSPDRWCTASAPSVSSRRCRRGAVRPEVICSMLSRPGVAVAAPGRVEADFRCFSTLLAPPQLPVRGLHPVGWNGVGAIFWARKRDPAAAQTSPDASRAHRAFSVPQGDCARRPVGRTQSAPYWV